MLIVRRIDLIKSGAEVFAPNETYILSPIYRRADASELEKIKQLKIPDHSQFTGIYNYFSDADRAEKQVRFLMNYNSTDDPSVRFVEGGSGGPALVSVREVCESFESVTEAGLIGRNHV